MKKRLFAILSVWFATGVMASTIEMEYHDFYRHIQNLQHQDTEGLKYSFGFMHSHSQVSCLVVSGNLILKNQTIKLNINDEYRFDMPSPDDPDLANGIVIITVKEPATECELSVRLETKATYLKAKYSQQDLLDIKRQYVAFFNEMGSFMSFAVPSVNGLMFTFENKDLYRDYKGVGKIQNGFMIIENHMLNDIQNIHFPAAPSRITALTSR